MRKTLSAIVSLAFLLVAMQAFAATTKPAPAKPAAKAVEYRCPFTGEKIANIKTAPKSVYKGKTYYFCCQSCKTKFDKNPAMHAKQIAAKSVPAAKNAPVMCPVMGGKVANPKTAPKSVYKGKTYYFCCPGCKPAFDKNPENYIKPKTAKKP